MSGSPNDALPAPGRLGRGGREERVALFGSRSTIVALVLAFAAACLVAVSWNSLRVLKQGAFSERRAKARAAVEMAHGVVARYGGLAERGEMTTAEAQRAAAATVRVLRYDDGEYVWINDLTPRMVMHAAQPELEGRDLSRFATPDGKVLFLELARVAEADPGGGFVSYRWPRPKGGEPVRKLSFVKLYRPWGWIVGSGIYLDDLDAAVAAQARRILGSTALLFALLCSAGAAVVWSARRANRLERRRRSIETTAREQARALQALSRCNQALVQASDEDALLRAVCRIIVEDGGYRMAWVGYAERDDRRTVRPVALAGVDDGYVSTVDAVWADGEPTGEPAGASIRKARPVLERDILSSMDAASALWRSEAVRRGYASVAALPLVADGAAMGCLAIYATEVESFDESELRLLVELANDLAFGIVALRARGERGRMMAQLAQADRLAAMGTLAAGVAHEINNPLAYVMAGLEFVGEKLRGTPAPPELGECQGVLDEMRDGCDRIREVVRDLKLFSRADGESTRLLDVRSVLDSSLKMAFNEIRHRARLTREYGPTPLVQANDARLGQVFLNLLINAAHAIAEGAAESNEIRVVTATDALGRAVVEVHDTGSGILPENRERIFEPFFTTKPIGLGTGLGLHICRDLVAAMGGAIAVESEVGKGSAFRVTLPAARERSSATPVPRAAPAPGRRGQVLAVDDEPLVLNAVRRALASEHDVTIEADPALALRRIASGERFDAIVCDLMMPEMTGVDFRGQVAVLDAAQADRVVFLTGGAFTAGTAAFMDSLESRVLEKPFERDALRSLVSSVME